MRILFTPYGGGSIAHMVRSFAVAKALEKRGHQILFTAPKSKKAFVEQAGFEVFGDGHAEVNLNDEHDQKISYFRDHREQFLDWLGDEIKAAEFFKPDIIVNSPSFFGPLVSLKLGIPYVAIVNAQWLLEFKGLLGLSKSENKLSHHLLRHSLRPIFSRRFDDLYMAEIRTFYLALGIPQLPRKRRDLHRRNPILIPGVPKFEPIDAVSRQDIHYIGPLFWEGFEDQPFDPEKMFKDFDKKPFIYVSLGGSIYRQQSYQELVAALAQKVEWNILLSLGPNISVNQFPNIPPHLVIKQFVPGLKACQQADVLVNTGSHGTVMQALWWGKPVVAIPHNIDQGTIAERLVELGIGYNLNKIKLFQISNREAYFQSATQVPWSLVLAKTEELLGDHKTQERAKAFQQTLRQYPNAAERAADYVTKYASIPFSV